MKHAGFTGHIGIAREDITPPVGIFCRNWGAATHDAAEGIHRPLTLTALTLQSDPAAKPLVLIDADLGWWVDLAFARRFRDRLLAELQLDSPRLIFALTHTHSAPPLCEPEPRWQGGHLIPPFVEEVHAAAIAATRAALAAAQTATLEFHTGRCNLAANRDLPHANGPDGSRIVCGYNPDAPADDNLLLGRLTNPAGKILATLVNYACHPTTLAWQNKLISPDYLGAFRETLQQNTGVPALFLQGASGELAPRMQYTGDAQIADAHGRQLAFAALSTLADMNPPAHELVFDRIVESGAPLAAWKYAAAAPSRNLTAALRTVDLPLKDWPAAAELQRQYETCSDRALAERLRRKLRIRQAIGDSATFPLQIWAWRIGDALLAGTMMESYSAIQQQLRARFPNHPLLWLNLINGSLGYLPPAEVYAEDLYQVWQTPIAQGGLESLTTAAATLLAELAR